MDSVSYILRYNTDLNTDLDSKLCIGYYTESITKSFEEVIASAIEKQCMMIVKSLYDNCWYIKYSNYGRDSKAYSQIKEHIELNKKNNYKTENNIWLIKYID